MANQPYFPNREGDQLTWFTNIQSKIPAYYTALDISAPRQAKLQLVLSWLIWTWQTYLPARRQHAPAPTPPAGTPFFGMLTWLFEEIGRWKAAEGYTDTIGQGLGIVGAAAAAHTGPPVLAEGAVAQNSIQITFTLYEHDGVWIESQR